MIRMNYEQYSVYRRMTKEEKQARLNAFRDAVFFILPPGSILKTQRVQFMLGVETNMHRVNMHDVKRIERMTRTELSAIGWGKSGVMLSFVDDLDDPNNLVDLEVKRY